eukprot:4434866-Amphidinium_carterae.2
MGNGADRFGVVLWLVGYGVLVLKNPLQCKSRGKLRRIPGFSPTLFWTMPCQITAQVLSY